VSTTCTRMMVIGYGNPGRLDDGLGPAFAERVTDLRLPSVTVEADYQLTVEDAVRIADYDMVLFADASVSGEEPFFCRPVVAVKGTEFSSHHVAPEQVLHLAASLFGVTPQAWVLGIRGYEFDEFGERLSEPARQNLDQAVKFFQDAANSGWQLLADAGTGHGQAQTTTTTRMQ